MKYKTNNLETIKFKKPWFRKRLYLSTKPYFMGRDLESGEKDLERLVDSGKVEGAWIFNSDNSIWFNIGYRTAPNRMSCYGLDLEKMNINSATHYHTHPKIAGKRRPITNRTLDVRFDPKIESVGRAIPSPLDIESYIDIVRYNPKCDIDFRIASSEGIITVDFADARGYAATLYRRIINKILPEVAFSFKDTRLGISNMVDVINQEMRGMFSVSMRYRE